MKSTLPGASRPDRSPAPLMPMAASGACATIEPFLIDEANIAEAEQHARSVGAALEHRVVDLHAQIGELVVDRRLDGRHERRQRDRPVGETSIAERRWR